MKSLIGIVFVSACLAAPALASEATKTSPTAGRTAQTFTDFSSAKRKPTTVTTAPVIVAPPKTVWTGADPSVGPGSAQFRQLQKEGRCVIDEGYGRYTGCNNY